MPASTSNPGSTAAPAAADGAVITAIYQVAGMSCGRCRAHITGELSTVEGVGAVEVDLDAGTVTVTSADGLDDTAIAAAIAQPGYQLTGRAR